MKKKNDDSNMTVAIYKILAINENIDVCGKIRLYPLKTIKRTVRKINFKKRFGKRLKVYYKDQDHECGYLQDLVINNDQNGLYATIRIPCSLTKEPEFIENSAKLLFCADGSFETGGLISPDIVTECNIRFFVLN